MTYSKHFDYENMKDKVREEVKEPKVTLKEIREFVSYDYDSVPARYLRVLLKLYDDKQKKKTDGDLSVKNPFSTELLVRMAVPSSFEGEAINEGNEEATGNIDTEGF